MKCFVCGGNVSKQDRVIIDFLNIKGKNACVHKYCDVVSSTLKSLKGGPLPIQADKYNATSNLISKRSKGQGQSNHKINQRRYKSA